MNSNTAVNLFTSQAIEPAAGQDQPSKNNMGVTEGSLS